MKILIETHRLLRRMGIYVAWSTMEVVQLTGKKRSSVLKRLHKLESVDIVEKRIDEERRFYWLVLFIPDKPQAPKLWRESKSIYELQAEKEDGNDRVGSSYDEGFGLHSTGTSGSDEGSAKRNEGRTDGSISEGYHRDEGS